VGLRDRLAAKKRRTLTVPVQVSSEDPGPAREDYARAQRMLDITQAFKPAAEEQEAHDRRLAAAQQKRDEALAVFREHYVEVEFVAGPPEDVERILETHATKDGAYAIESLPELAALCVVEEDLRDPQWWAAQFTSGAWAKGERDGLWLDLLKLNTNAPPEHLPKD
jgi:hypothetical protein